MDLGWPSKLTLRISINQKKKFLHDIGIKSPNYFSTKLIFHCLNPLPGIFLLLINELIMSQHPYISSTTVQLNFPTTSISYIRVYLPPIHFNIPNSVFPPTVEGIKSGKMAFKLNPLLSFTSLQMGNHRYPKSSMAASMNSSVSR